MATSHFLHRMATVSMFKLKGPEMQKEPPKAPATNTHIC